MFDFFCDFAHQTQAQTSTKGAHVTDPRKATVKKNSSWLESVTGKPAPRASLGIPMPMPDGMKKRGDA